MTIKKNGLKGDSNGRVTLPNAKEKSNSATNKTQERKSVRALYPSERTTIERRVLSRAVSGAIKQRAAHK